MTSGGADFHFLIIQSWQYAGGGNVKPGEGSAGEDTDEPLCENSK